jgi:hypothetical protein
MISHNLQRGEPIRVANERVNLAVRHSVLEAIDGHAKNR